MMTEHKKPKALVHGSARLLLDQVCRAADLGPALQLRRHNTGSVHVVYRVLTPRGLFAVRVGPSENASQAWQQQARFAHLRIAPRLLHEGTEVFEKRARRYSVSEWLNGRRFDYRRDLRRLATTLAFLHRRTRGQQLAPLDAGDVGGYLRTQLSRYASRRARGGGIEERLHRAAATELSTLTQGREVDSGFRCLVHNDLIGQNIIIASGHAHLVDWDWAINAGPALDLCGFLSPFVTSWDRERALSDRAVATFLDCYLGFFSRTDARAVRRSLTSNWSGYNAVAANWLYHESTTPSHLRAAGFYRRAFARSEGIGAWLRTWMQESSRI